jgi:hypothetical protein
MPLRTGKSDKTRNANIKEMMDAYKKTGMIGKTKPRDAKHAAAIASAIAYQKQRSA